MMDPHEAHAIRQLWVSVAVAAIMDAVKDVHREKVYLDHVPKSPKGRLEMILSDHSYYFKSKDWRKVCENAGLAIKSDDVIDLLYKAPGSRELRSLVKDMQ